MSAEQHPVTDEEILRRAEVLTTYIELICEGEHSASAFIAISNVIGRFAAQAERPDLHGTMRLISEGAFDAFRQARREQHNG